MARVQEPSRWRLLDLPGADGSRVVRLRRWANSASLTAVADAMTPYCIEKSKIDPRSVEVLAELKAAKGYNRRGVIEKAGWATLLGAEQPNTDLARACEAALAAT
jgi:hypothetical protein